MQKTIGDFTFYFDNDGQTLARVEKERCSSSKELIIPSCLNVEKIKYIKTDCFSNLVLNVLDLSNLEVNEINDSFKKCNVAVLIFPKNLKRIGERCFEECMLKSVKIPDTVESIGAYAFHNTNANIEFPENTSIKFDDYALRGNRIESLIVWPKWQLACYCFEDCRIENILISDGIKKIPHGCFRQNRIKNLKLPSSIHTIGIQSFGCNKISTIDIKWENVKILDYGAFSDNKIKGTLDLSNLTVNIEPRVFENNNIENVIFNDYILTIGVYAFATNNITKVNYPPYIKNIGVNAFFPIISAF